MVKLRAFRANDDPATCGKFIEGHTRMLNSVGVTKVTSNKVDWPERDSVFVLVVEDVDTGEVLGGARVHAYDGKNPLPVEEAVSFMDNSVPSFVRQYADNGCGEICGLWNSRKVAGMGFGSLFLTRAAVAITSQIGLRSIVALCASYTVQTAARFGYKIVESVGNNGTFYYPKLDLLATFMLLPDTLELKSAKKLEQNKIGQLRNDPNIMVSERTRISTVDIKYDLDIKMASIEEFHFPTSRI